MWSWPRARDPIAIGIAAALVRLIAYFRQPELAYDGFYYLRQAERLAAGTYDWIGFPPGFPLVAAGARWLTGDWVMAARLVSLVAGTATAVMAWSWARARLSRRWALVAALAVALHPHHARISVEALSEPLFGCVVLAALQLFERRRDAAAGMLAGFAYLVRPEGLLFYGGLLLVRAARTRRVPVALALGMGWVVLYAFLASRAAGHPVLTPKQGQLDFGAGIGPRAWTLVRMLHGCFPLLLVPGAFWLALRKAPQTSGLFAATALTPLFAVHIQERMHLPLLPVWLVLGCGWLSALAPRPRRIATALAAATLALGVAPGARLWWRGLDLVPGARAIGTALRSELQSSDRVAARFPQVPYFAGAGFVRAPREAPYPTLMDSIARHGATHLLVLESEIGHVLPQLRPLFETAAFVVSDSRIATAAVLASPPGRRAILYRLHPAPLSAGVVPLTTTATGVAWSDGDLIVATPDGELMSARAGRPAPTPEFEAEPATDGDGVGIVCVQSNATARWIARFDPVRNHFEAYAATRADAPRSPTAVGSVILYVRDTAPIGLRALDRRTGRVHAVRLQGLGDTDGVPRAVRARGEDIVVTYARESGSGQRIVATCRWPGITAGEIGMPGRWATSLDLADDAIAWLAEGDAVVAALQVGDTVERSALCAVHPGGRVWRLSFGISGARRPALAGDRIAFLDLTGTPHAGTWDPRTAQLPATRTFDPTR